MSTYLPINSSLPEALSQSVTSSCGIGLLPTNIFISNCSCHTGFKLCFTIYNSRKNTLHCMIFFLSTSGGLAPLALIHLGLHGIALPLIPEDLRVTVRHIHWTYITDMYMGHYENWPDNQFSHHSWYANSSLCYHHHHTCIHMVFHTSHT